MPNPLPTPGADDDVWGTKLNACLETSIDGATGNLLEAAVVDAIPTLTGDVSGSLPGPIAVDAIDGIVLSGTPTPGEVLTATGSAAANWQTPAAAPLTGDVTTVSTAATLVGTSNVESIIRAQTFNQLTAPSSAMSANNERWINLGLPLVTTDAAQATNAILGATYYEPGGGGHAYTTTSATMAAVDTTNLTVSFTPISSTVLVELTCQAGYFANFGNLVFCLFTHGTTTQVGFHMTALTATAPGSVFLTTKTRITGLAAGTTYQVDWAWGTTTGNSGTAIMTVNAVASGGAGIDGGPAAMRVFAV